MGEIWSKTCEQGRDRRDQLEPPAAAPSSLPLAVPAGLAPSVAVGAVVAHKVPQACLKLTVATVLVLSSVILIAKLLLEAGDDESSGSGTPGLE